MMIRRTFEVFILFAFIVPAFAFAQADTLSTIVFERSNAKGKIVSKTVAPWKVFHVYTKKPDKRHFPALSLVGVNDSSMIISTRKTLVIRSTENKFLPPTSSVVYFEDTVLFKDISAIKARTKKYNLRRGLGFGLLYVSIAGFLAGLEITAMPYQETGTRVVGLGGMLTAAASFACSIKLIKMRRFETQKKWQIKAGYIIKKR